MTVGDRIVFAPTRTGSLVGWTADPNGASVGERMLMAKTRTGALVGWPLAGTAPAVDTRVLLGRTNTGDLVTWALTRSTGCSAIQVCSEPELITMSSVAEIYRTFTLPFGATQPGARTTNTTPAPSHPSHTAYGLQLIDPDVEHTDFPGFEPLGNPIGRLIASSGEFMRFGDQLVGLPYLDPPFSFGGQSGRAINVPGEWLVAIYPRNLDVPGHTEDFVGPVTFDFQTCYTLPGTSSFSGSVSPGDAPQSFTFDCPGNASDLNVAIAFDIPENSANNLRCKLYDPDGALVGTFFDSDIVASSHRAAFIVTGGSQVGTWTLTIEPETLPEAGTFDGIWACGVFTPTDELPGLPL